MATLQRIYLVTDPQGNTRLVRASMRQQALSYVANMTFSVRVASQDDLVEVIGSGVEVENYKALDQSDLDLGHE